MSQGGIVLIGSGPSLSGFDLQTIPAHLPVMAVNTAARRVPRYNFFFSLDPSPVVDEILRNLPNPHARHFLAVDNDYGLPSCATPSHRGRERYAHVKYLERVRGPGPLSSCYGLSVTPGRIHTGNSLYGALGLAFLMGFRNIAILGLDGRQGGRWCDGGRTGNLDHLPALFASATAQLSRAGVSVYNGSPESAVTCFPRMTPGEAVEEAAKYGRRVVIPPPLFGEAAAEFCANINRTRK